MIDFSFILQYNCGYIGILISSHLEIKVVRTLKRDVKISKEPGSSRGTADLSKQADTVEAGLSAALSFLLPF